MSLHIFSDMIAMGQVGIKTNFLDDAGKPLYTGDIILVYTEDYPTRSLTSVVQQDDEYFIMGIRGCVMHRESVDTTPYYVFNSGIKFFVCKLKSYKDVVAGEHWSDFGFHYKMITGE